MRAVWLILIVIVVGVFICTAQEDEEGKIVLPRQMGAINDYAAILDSGRAALQAQLNGIKQNFDVQLVILATIFDPFDNPQIFAQRIWEYWKLGARTTLLLFTKEQSGRWAFELRLSEDLRSTFRPEHLERLRQGLKPHLERKRIKIAMEEAATALQAMLDGSYGQPLPSPPPIEFNWHWVLIGLGGLIGVGSLVLGVRALVKHYCPRCGARLRSYRQTSYSRRGGRVEYLSCPRCGYSRTR